MAKKRKPKHTSLILPSDREKENTPADRLGRSFTQGGAPHQAFDLEQSDDPTAKKPSKAAKTPEDASLFDFENGDAPAPAPGYGALPDGLSGSNAPRKAPQEKAASAAAPSAASNAGSPAKPAAGKATPAVKQPLKKQGASQKASGLFKKRKPGPQPAAAAKPSNQSTGPQVGEALEISGDDLPENAIVMPRSGPRFAAVRKKKFRRRIGMLVVALLILVAIALYLTGAYLYLGLGVSSVAESVRISLTPGDGWPAKFSLTGYIKSEPMGSGGFTALGEKDCYIYSSTGAELWSVQHSYGNPGISAGNTRVCLYNRGGQDYSIEGRGETVARRSTPQSILFAEMSPGGWLALVTSSRYNVTLQIFNPLYENEPDLKLEWPIIDQTPVLAAFNSDNKTLAVGCLSTGGGALGTTINIYQVGRSELQGTIRADDARIVEAHYTGSNLLVYYDTHAVLYNASCEEKATFDYGGRRLLAASAENGRSALILGSLASENIEVKLLDANLTEVFSRQAQSTSSLHVLLASNGLLLMLGQEVEAYSNEGVSMGTATLEARAYGLVYGGEPLALCAGTVEPVGGLLEKSTAQAASAPSAASSAGTG